MYKIVRRQVYSAIAHRVAGVFFWFDSSDTAEFIDRFVDVAKEINMHRFILEQDNNYDWNYDYQVDLRTIQINDRFWMFAMNKENSQYTTSHISQFQTCAIGPEECGVWTSKGGETLKLSSPINLGFEEDKFVSYPPTKGWWKHTDDGTFASFNTTQNKLGDRSIELRGDKSAMDSTSRACVEQFFNCTPGGVYKVNVWCKKGLTNPSMPDYYNQQRLVIQLYDDNSWIREKSILSGLSTDWKQVGDTIHVDSSARRIKIHLGTLRGKTSTYYWDDVTVKMVGYNCGQQALPKEINQTGNSDKQRFIQLVNIYPNPCDSELNINYKTFYPTHVKISIYNITGSLVECLYDALTQPKSHEIRCTCQNLSNGIYFIRIDTPKKSITKKITVIR